MKKSKLITAVVMSLCLVGGGIGIAACSSDNSAGKDPDIYAVYQTYVAYAESNGDAVQSYEEWLESIKGANGRDGINGTDGKDGKDGADGKSAYEIWLAAGNTGTEADFLASLKGDSGAQGAQGSQGAQGAKGEDGKDGADGKDGVDGKDGEDAPTIVGARQEYGDRWNITSYFVFEFSDGSVVTTEDTPMVIVVPNKYYDAENDDEYNRLIQYGVEKGYINIHYQREIIGISSNGVAPVSILNGEEEFNEWDFYNQVSVSVQYENGEESIPVNQLLKNGGNVDINNLDMHTVGAYTITVEYNGMTCEIPVAVCDYNLSEEDAQPIYIYAENVSLPVGVSVEELSYKIYLQVLYSNAQWSGGPLAEIAPEADLSVIDTETAGTYFVPVTVDGLQGSVTVEIYKIGGNPSERFLAASMTGEDTKSSYAYNGTPITQIDIYSDFTAEIYLANSGDERQTQTVLTVDWEMNQAEMALYLSTSGTKIAVFTIEGDMETSEINFTDYNFTGEPFTSVNGTDSQGREFTLSWYENGMATIDFGEGAVYNVGIASSTEPEEDGSYLLRVIGISFFSATVDEESGIPTALAPVTVEGETTPTDGSSVSEFYGMWNAYYMYAYDESEPDSQIDYADSASLKFNADGTVYLYATYQGVVSTASATWTYDATNHTMTMTIKSEDVVEPTMTVTISDGIMTITQEHDDFHGVVKLKK